MPAQLFPLSFVGQSRASAAERITAKNAARAAAGEGPLTLEDADNLVASVNDVYNQVSSQSTL